MFPFFDLFADILARVLHDRGWTKRFLGAGLILSLALLTSAGVLALLRQVGVLAVPIEVPITLLLVSAFGVGFLASIVQNLERAKKTVQIERVEQQVREHPEKPQLAWDLARTKLESYLDRNLSQVRSIYWLTLLVMASGFGLILYGLMQSFNTPAKLQVSIVASASGILISFIGGSFLIIYKSILAQSQEYVSVLERINAVGMAVQVLSSIDDQNGALRDQATAELSKQLLSMYGGPGPAPTSLRRVTQQSAIKTP